MRSRRQNESAYPLYRAMKSIQQGPLSTISLVKDGIINDNLDIENEKFGKALLTEELELYQKSKFEELIVEPISVLTLEDCDKTTPCQRCASNKRQMWTHSSEYF